MYRDIIQCLESHLTVGIFFITEKRYFVEGKGRDSFANLRHMVMTTHTDSSPHFYLDRRGILLH